MPRPEGAPNAKPTKSEIIARLREKGIDCKNDGVAIKKSVLEEMAKKAGIDIYEKRSATAKRPGSSIEACLMTIHGRGNKAVTPGATSSINISANTNDPLEFNDDFPLNQEGVAATTGHVLAVNNNGPNTSTNQAANNIWIPELRAQGYNLLGRPAPNLAVQTIIACILRDELHQFIIQKESNVPNSDNSAIIHMGMSNFLTMVAGFSKANYNIDACKEIINIRYSRLPMAQYVATEKEAANLRTFVRTLTALERANGVKFTFPTNNNRRARPRATATQVKVAPNQLTSNCLFSVSMLPEEYKTAFTVNNDNNNNGNDNNQTEETERVPIAMLNLFNCGRFPIMSQREVESHGEQYKQALWKSKNLGVLAPISMDAWRKLAGISDEDVKDAYSDADNCIRRVDKLEIILPFPAKCLGLECSNSMVISIGQKNHQAKVDERRHDFYIKKMWRTLCPFIKCTCGKTARDNGDCPDSIIWLDHAIWFLMNNLEMAWPKLPTVVRFGYFCSFLSTKPVQDAVLALIGYIRVRDIMMRMAIKYAEDSSLDLNMEFGNTILTDVLEKTIKPLKFLIGKQQESSGANDNISNRKRAIEPNSPSCSLIMPPKLYKRPESSYTMVATSNNTEGNNNAVINIDDSNQADRSVNKTRESTSRSYDVEARDFDV